MNLGGVCACVIVREIVSNARCGVNQCWCDEERKIDSVMPVVMHKVAYAGSEARRRVKKSEIQVGQKKRYFRVCFAHSSGQSERAYGNMG